MTTPPTPQEWLSENPGKTLNDYYSKFKHVTVKTEQTFTISELTEAANLLRPEKTVNRSLIVSIITCVVGLLGYFTPWLNVPIFNINISGSDISQLVNFFSKRDFDGNQTFVNYIQYLYFIPISYVLIVLGVLSKSYFVTGVSALINILLVGFVLGKLLQLPEITSFIGMGIYFLGISVLGMLYLLFTLDLK